MLKDSKFSSSSKARNFLLDLCLDLDVCWLRGVADAGALDRRAEEVSFWKNCCV